MEPFLATYKICSRRMRRRRKHTRYEVSSVKEKEGKRVILISSVGEGCKLSLVCSMQGEDQDKNLFWWNQGKGSSLRIKVGGKTQNAEIRVKGSEVKNGEISSQNLFSGRSRWCMKDWECG
ncbi:hypothetical protein E2542_SST00721 [Spatholobus suberectus]|nr:hypothetical protein E2542_SST00721 [Spatholobus suberectus]